MKLTPLPLIVCAMMQLGLPGSNGTWFSVLSMAERSCPSISRVAHPKARPLCRQRIQVNDLFHPPKTLDLVVVDHGNEIIEFMLRCKQRGFPD